MWGGQKASGYRTRHPEIDQSHEASLYGDTQNLHCVCLLQNSLDEEVLDEHLLDLIRPSSLHKVSIQPYAWLCRQILSYNRVQCSPR